jgi:hypothetical protein
MPVKKKKNEGGKHLTFVKHAAADQDYIGNCFRKVTL